jgi:DNA-binding HxlR family transcriptional regulator
MTFQPRKSSFLSVGLAVVALLSVFFFDNANGGTERREGIQRKDSSGSGVQSLEGRSGQAGTPTVSEETTPAIPEFEFDVHGRPPSRSVYGFVNERVVQKILFVINDRERTPAETANRIGETEAVVVQKLNELQKFGLVKQQARGWISQTRLYTRAQIQEGETLSAKYAELEAEILRQAVPRLREVYAGTQVSKTFPWEDMSLLVVGALLSDFCVVDRIPFRPQNVGEEKEYYLQTPEGKRWGFSGYEKLPKRFPSCRWTFYQNQYRKYDGGLTRFGYLGNPNEQRKDPVINPAAWCMGPEGKILFALSEKPLSLSDLESATEMRQEMLQSTLDKLAGYDPPAVARESNLYRVKVPIFTASDFSLLLSECDRVAEDIYEKVVRPHAREKLARAGELGCRWPIPSGTYVRDKALQILVEEGLLSPVPSAPVGWNFGVWGWRGFMPLNEEVTEGARPDPFLVSAVGGEEKKRIQEAENQRTEILKGSKFRDLSTPAKAFLTRFSAFVHTDVGALREVQVPAGQIDDNFFADPKRRGWPQEMSKLSIRRLPPVPVNPKEGDICVVLALYEKSFEDAHVYFYYKGGWRFLFNTQEVGFWNKNAGKAVEEKLASLR